MFCVMKWIEGHLWAASLADASSQGQECFPFMETRSLSHPEITQPPLPYKEDALEPYISKKTIGFHYGKHHKAYVDKTNELAGPAGLGSLSLEEIIKKTAGSAGQIAIFNNAAQAWNHNFYWKSMLPGASKPNERLTK